jgi:integrase
MCVCVESRNVDKTKDQTPASAQSGQSEKERAAAERKQAALAFIGGNRNKNTALTYAGGWKRFQAYLNGIGVEAEGVTEVEVAAFLQERYEKDGVKSSTLQADKAAIADGLKVYGNGASAGEMVTKMMAVLVAKAQPPTPKRHMSLELMRGILQSLRAEGDIAAAGASTPAIRRALLARRNSCLLLFMLLGMLRSSEAVSLAEADVVLEDVGGITTVSLFIRRSKGDQEQKGEEVRLGENKGDVLACPVGAYKLYRTLKDEHRKSKPEEAFFSQLSGAPLSAATPNHLVQGLVVEANQRWNKATGEVQHFGAPEMYGSHSMRRGGVTLARDSGVSMLDIQRHGRWKSLLVFDYVGRTVEQQLAVTATLMQPGRRASTQDDSDCMLVESRGKGDKLGKAAAVVVGNLGTKFGQGVSRKRRLSQEEEDDADDLDENIFVHKYINHSAASSADKKSRGPRGPYGPRKNKTPQPAAKKPRLELTPVSLSAPAKQKTRMEAKAAATVTDVSSAKRKLNLPADAEVIDVEAVSSRTRGR